MNIIYQNGEFLPANEAKISIYDRAFLFGEGLFESFRSHDQQLPLLKQHLARLEWSATYLNIPFPMDVNFESICLELMKKNGFEDARFKITLSTCGDSSTPNQSKDSAENTNPPQITIYCEKLDPEKLPNNYKIKTLHSVRNDFGTLASVKTQNYLSKIMGRREAIDSNYDDGILLNLNDQVTETTTGNIFWVDKDSQLHTVHESCGILPGITRSTLMKLVQDKKLSVKESVLSAKDLSNAKEVFITNSVLGIMPVTMVDKRVMSGGEIGDVTAMLKDLYRNHLETLTKTN